MGKRTRSLKPCAVEDCNLPISARGYCNKHYLRFRNHGDPLYTTKAAATPVVTLEDGRRVCKTCGQAKPVTDYHKDNRSKDGYRAQCKPCRNGYMSDYYQTNRDRIVQYERVRRRDETERMREIDRDRYYRNRDVRMQLATDCGIIRRARKAGVLNETGITANALRKLHGDHCYYCDKELDFKRSTRGTGIPPNRASIEHLIPISKGGEHTWENVVLACHQCNVSKNARSVDEYRAWLAAQVDNEAV